MARVKGHHLISEGKAHVTKRKCCEGVDDPWWRMGSAGEGHAKCSCGKYGPHQTSGTQRRLWHRDVHKAEVALLDRDSKSP